MVEQPMRRPSAASLVRMRVLLFDSRDEGARSTVTRCGAFWLGWRLSQQGVVWAGEQRFPFATHARSIDDRRRRSGAIFSVAAENRAPGPSSSA
jgi:hypothetical protein